MNSYFLPLVALCTLLVIIVAYLPIRYNKKISKLKTQLEEKEEKINWLRQINAENEHKNTQKDHEAQKQVMELEHRIQELETRAKEGSKNQVLSKLEAQQAKRERLLKRAGLGDE